MTQAVNQTFADSASSSNQTSSNAAASNVSTLAATSVSTTAILQTAVLNAVMLSCVDIASKQDSDNASLNNARTDASSEDATSTQEENNSNEANSETAHDASNKASEALNQFFSEMDHLSEQETQTDDSNNVAFAPGEGPSGGAAPINAALVSYLFFVFEAMKNADASTGERMIASGNSEIVLGTNITNMVYDAWTTNPNTMPSQSIDGYSGSGGNGILGGDAALFQWLSEQSGDSNQSNWLSQASTQESIDSSTANTNEGTTQQQTQTWANQLSNDSQDEQGLLTTMIPDITGFGQQMAGYLGSPLPA